jgi:hypothetical protein
MLFLYYIKKNYYMINYVNFMMKYTIMKLIALFLCY